MHEPYEYLCQDSDTVKYYLLKLQGMDSPYIAIEHDFKLNKIVTKRWGKPKTTPISIQVGMKLVPLRSCVMYLMLQALNTRASGEDELEGLGKQTIYPCWDRTDADTLQVSFAELVAKAKSDDVWTFDAPTNAVVKGFVDDGFFYFGTEARNSVERAHWLYRTTILGNLVLVYVKEAGVIGKSAVGVTDINVFGRNTMDKIVAKMQKKGD